MNGNSRRNIKKMLKDMMDECKQKKLKFLVKKKLYKKKSIQIEDQFQ